jgi:hypothetical protein
MWGVNAVDGEGLYNYRRGQTLATYAPLIIYVSLCAFFIWLPLRIDHKNFFTLYDWKYVILFLVMLYPGTYGVLSLFFSRRPVELSETGITAMIWGAPWRSIPWGEVTKIEKFRISRAGMYSRQITIRICGKNNIIRVVDKIRNFDKIREYLNKIIVQYKIPVYTVDGWVRRPAPSL